MTHTEKIIVLDFGGQYNQLIARRVRECSVYCEVHPYTTPLPELLAMEPSGIILTGGPNSVYDPTSPHYDPALFETGIPILGICYGAQLMAWSLGGRVETAPTSEYGKTEVTAEKSTLLSDVPERSIFWMSHTDYIAEVPDGFRITASTPVCPVAAMEDDARKLYATQFHPEVTHSEFGTEVLSAFVYGPCGCSGSIRNLRLFHHHKLVGAVIPVNSNNGILLCFRCLCLFRLFTATACRKT